jgi:LL-diaminopimelate aminotransferase
MGPDHFISDRIKHLPPYPFAKLDALKAEEIKKGRSLISLSIGDPDLPTPDFIVERLIRAAKNPANHQYPSYWGMPPFREAVAKWFGKRFGVKLDPQSEVLALIGSKEGIAHTPLAYLNPGDAALVPDPGYPVYSVATQFVGAKPLVFSLRAENHYLPDFSEIEALLKQNPRTKIWFLNYPNNPTSASVDHSFFKDVVAFAKKHEILVCHDNAYSELYFDGQRPPSILEIPGAKEVACEYHSLSKTFNMTGWRVGFFVGSAGIVDGLAKVKTNMDSGVFNACQEAAIAALTEGESFCEQLRSIYQKRRDILVPALQAAGLECKPPSSTFYVWCRLPSQKGWTSESFVTELIKKKGIVATPGTAFGRAGEGFVRLTLCSDESVLKQVAEALRTSL